MSIEIKSIKSHGLETWNVLIDGSVLYTFLSEHYARMRYLRLCQKLGIKSI